MKSDVAEVPMMLRELEQSTILGANAATKDLLSGVTARLGTKADTALPFSSNEIMELKERCEELRLRLLAVSLATGLGVHLPELDPLLGVGNELLPGPVVHEVGGVVFTVLADAAVILLPQIQNISQCHDVLQALSVIYDETRCYRTWVFDLSLTTELPVMFLGTLLSYDRQLHESDKNLTLCFLKPNLFPQGSEEQLIKRLDLALIGGYWFSRRLRVT